MDLSIGCGGELLINKQQKDVYSFGPTIILMDIFNDLFHQLPSGKPT